jgi:hypothetical protein
MKHQAEPQIHKESHAPRCCAPHTHTHTHTGDGNRRRRGTPPSPANRGRGRGSVPDSGPLCTPSPRAGGTVPDCTGTVDSSRRVPPTRTRSSRTVILVIMGPGTRWPDRARHRGAARAGVRPTAPSGTERTELAGSGRAATSSPSHWQATSRQLPVSTGTGA